MRTPDDIYDQWLVIRCRSGDAEALRELVDRWQPRLMRQALRLADGCDAAEVVQETWLAILRSFDRLEDPAAFRAWAYRIVTNKCASAVRSRQHQRTAQASLCEEPAGQDRLESADDVERLRATLRQLPADMRTILAMLYVDGLSIRDIAQAMDLPEGTVKSRLHAARQELKQLLERSRP
jgi:RNA polymerase sigma factor (sigma-70 family)